MITRPLTENCQNQRPPEAHYTAPSSVHHMSLLVNGRFPPINPILSTDVTPEERITAIDFVNRLNFLFQEFDHEKIINAFTEDCVVYHYHGTIKGHDGNRKFLKEQYGYLIPGVVRDASNHIVDRDGDDGVTVRYHEHLVRYAWPEEDAQEHNRAKDDGLPGIWIFSPLIDRLKKTDEGWKLYERYVGSSIVNEKLDPSGHQR